MLQKERDRETARGACVCARERAHIGEGVEVVVNEERRVRTQILYLVLGFELRVRVKGLGYLVHKTPPPV